MRDEQGRFKEGYRASPETEFEEGEHWREEKPYWDEDWLREHYREKFMSAQEIADMFDVTENAILYWLDKHGIETWSMEEIRKKKHWAVQGEENWMYGRTGKDNPNYKGGITSERQRFYESQEWKEASQKVWERDDATCQRCGTKKPERADLSFHIHHIVSFEVKELRADPDNLILLCEPCHHWVHSNDNTEKEYIQEK